MHSEEARRLVELKIGMEFGVLPEGDVMPPAANNDEGQPRLLLSCFDGGHAMYLRHDLPPATMEALRALGPERALADEAAVLPILDAHAPRGRTWLVRWYVFERQPGPAEYLDATIRAGRYVVLVDDDEAAWAVSTRANDAAEEVTIETVEAFRRRGYGRQVTTAWAADVLRRGKVAFYSHNADNAASAAVARSLGLTWLSDEVEYE